jgi:hypothetical protein
MTQIRCIHSYSTKLSPVNSRVTWLNQSFENNLCSRHRGNRELIISSLITRTEMVLTALIHLPFYQLTRSLADKILLHAFVVQASNCIYSANIQSHTKKEILSGLAYTPTQFFKYFLGFTSLYYLRQWLPLPHSSCSFQKDHRSY